MIAIKRAYAGYKKTDGFRILVDNFWPRGLTKSKAHIDMWLKEVAPSSALRTWFGHRPDRFRQFEQKYRRELAANREFIPLLKRAEKLRGTVTLVYAAKDESVNHAAVLQRFLESLPGA